PGHQWLNIFSEVNKLFDKEDFFLILVNAFIQGDPLVDHCDRILMIERVKFLQKRYPKLKVIGLQCVGSAKALSIHSEVLKTIMEEYITFPILIVDRKLIKVIDSAVYLFSEGSTGSLSVDEDGGRIFISDCNHHRIIIIDGDGKVLDSIGSSPGFVDADFDSAKLWRPAASFYNVSDECLYFVDSENNAIRRADMSSRLVETVYPIPKPSGFWGQILGVWNRILKISGLGIDHMKSEELVFNQIACPWHMSRFGDDEVIIVSRSCSVAWILSMATWKIKEVITGHQNIFGNYRNLMAEKLSFLNEANGILQQRFSILLEKNPFTLMSSFGRFQNDIIFLDADGQNVLKFNWASKTASFIQFSNVGVLGLPYWLSCPIERVYNSGNYIDETIEHVQNFRVLPGRVDIRVNVDIPRDAKLAAPLDDNCVWYQAKGSSAVVSKTEDENTPREKVGIAQQWFDELDNLAFLNTQLENSECTVQNDDKSIEKGLEDTEKPKLNCAVNVSPGTSEIIVSAALYLKLSPTVNLKDATSILNPREHKNSLIEAERFRSYLENCGEMTCVIFTRPLHLRIKLYCGDHPAAATSKETILTDTQLEMNVMVK
ncbi:hypothetical protein HPP92_003255, partial [Vanilla planifolia]